MSKILVTGATGFIGSNLVKELLRKNFRVKCLVRQNGKELERIGAEVVYGQITDLEFLKKITSDVEVVFHLAAIRGQTDKSKKDYWEVNVKGTENILKAAGKEKRIIHCSSVGVLGWPKEKIALDNSPYQTTRGNQYYHLSKIEAEKKVKEAIGLGHRATIVRPTIIYGRNDFDGMIFKLIKMIKQRNYFQIGKGDNYLHLVDVRNLVEAFILVLENKNSIGRIYIIGDGQALRIREIVSLISQVLKVKIFPLTLPVFLAKSIGLLAELFFKNPPLDVYRINLLTKNQRYDISRAEKELGYQPKFDIKDSLIELTKYYDRSGYL